MTSQDPFIYHTGVPALSAGDQGCLLDSGPCARTCIVTVLFEIAPKGCAQPGAVQAACDSDQIIKDTKDKKENVIQNLQISLMCVCLMRAP